MTLPAFLLARIAEDETAAGRRPLGERDAGRGSTQEDAHDPTYRADPTEPARVLAECRVKRELLVLAYEATGLDQTVDMERATGSRQDSGVHYVGDRILRAMASVYDGHPDFDPDWRT